MDDTDAATATDDAAASGDAVPSGDGDARLDRGRIDDALAAAGADGYLLDADGEVSDQRYLSGFSAPDPFVTLFADGAVHLLVSGLEYGRAREEAAADSVERLSAFGFRELMAEHGREGARVRATAAFLETHDVGDVVVPQQVPLGTADGLREEGLAVEVDRSGVLGELRATKRPGELDAIRTAQRATERAMARAEGLLAAAESVPPAELADVVGTPDDELPAVEGSAPVLVQDGQPLTSERVREAIDVSLLRSGCALEETIVAGGAQGAEPHNRGSGPLRGGEPIVVDIFPADAETGYHADMTRTFVVGEPTAKARAFYETTREAQAAGLAAIEPGVTGEAVDRAVAEVYEDAGYETLYAEGEEPETGFIHGTGHGVGLDVHERPTLSRGAGEELAEGNVVTVEPGLYDPAVGGVRIEDLVVVTEDGHENLTDYDRTFEV